tara:strand:- start:2026 stop:2232 length:207 start_codon:yes stop_codon:yes gene_type:complete
MTVKVAAKEIVERFLSLDMHDYEDYVYWMEKENAKKCALICVDEILSFDLRFLDIEFLKEVKQEINKL